MPEIAICLSRCMYIFSSSRWGKCTEPRYQLVLMSATIRRFSWTNCIQASIWSRHAIDTGREPACHSKAPANSPWPYNPCCKVNREVRLREMHPASSKENLSLDPSGFGRRRCITLTRKITSSRYWASESGRKKHPHFQREWPLQSLCVRLWEVPGRLVKMDNKSIWPSRIRGR